MSNIDKPDDVAFARAIAQNLPSADDKRRFWYGILAAHLVGKVVKGVSRDR
jgi:hypothetical protein